MLGNNLDNEVKVTRSQKSLGNAPMVYNGSLVKIKPSILEIQQFSSNFHLRLSVTLKMRSLSPYFNHFLSLL